MVIYPLRKGKKNSINTKCTAQPLWPWMDYNTPVAVTQPTVTAYCLGLSDMGPK